MALAPFPIAIACGPLAFAALVVNVSACFNESVPVPLTKPAGVLAASIVKSLPELLKVILVPAIRVTLVTTALLSVNLMSAFAPSCT